VSSLFTKATKAEAKARIAVTGPSGSGKTFSALAWATELADGGKIAVIDTERDSAKLYADRFDFDTLSMSAPYHPDRLVEVLKAAEAEGYAVVVIDSLTHFYNGAGGLLEIVDLAGSKAGGNGFAGWKTGTPIQQRMVDTLLNFNGHIISTMRSKTEYTLEKGDNGRTAPRKVGMAPIQRDGIEYEFTLVVDMDVDHRTIIGKTRCEALADKVFAPNKGTEAAQIFNTWLKSGDPIITDTERDVLDGRIRTLTPAQRRSLAKAWGEAGLPKVNSLTQARLSEAQELVASCSTLEEEEPTEDVVPE